MFFVLDRKLMTRVIIRVWTCWWPRHIDKVLACLRSSNGWNTWCYNQ